MTTKDHLDPARRHDFVLLFDVTDHYNLSAPTLFLSGAAGEGELVRAVAEQRSTGC